MSATPTNFLRTVVKAGAASVPAPPGTVVLIYHRVGRTSSLDVDLSTAEFDRQIEWLASEGRTRTLQAALDGLDRPSPPRPPPPPPPGRARGPGPPPPRRAPPPVRRPPPDRAPTGPAGPIGTVSRARRFSTATVCGTSRRRLRDAWGSKTRCVPSRTD